MSMIRVLQNAKRIWHTRLRVIQTLLHILAKRVSAFRTVSSFGKHGQEPDAQI